MRFEKFTTKLQEALAEAQSTALGKDQQYIEPEHLLAALLNQEDGGIAGLVSKAGGNPGVLKKIAKVTGGESYFPESLTSLHSIWPRIAGAIRGQYTIGYVSSNPVRDGEFRKVKITATAKRKLLDVRTRPGYVSSGAPTSVNK